MDKTAEESLTERQRYWLDHIRACEASGKCIADYALEHGIQAQAMYAGKKSLVQKGILPRAQANRFLRAQVVGPVVGCEWHIQLPNGVSVEFAGDVDAGALCTVLRSAAALA